MGQRHQIYVVKKSGSKYEALGAFHHQWCYGLRAATNLARATDLILKNKVDSFSRGQWSEFRLSDAREIESLIKGTYGIDLDGSISMVHNEADYLITDGQIKPELGDNNDGCSLIIIDDEANEVRAGFFTPGHVEGSHGDKCKANTAYSLEEYIGFYYNAEEIQDDKFKSSYADNIALLLSVDVKPFKQDELRAVLGIKAKAAPKARKPRKTATTESKGA